jgi:hypothetical protein
MTLPKKLDFVSCQAAAAAKKIHFTSFITNVVWSRFQNHLGL